MSTTCLQVYSLSVANLPPTDTKTAEPNILTCQDVKILDSALASAQLSYIPSIYIDQWGYYLGSRKYYVKWRSICIAEKLRLSRIYQGGTKV